MAIFQLASTKFQITAELFQPLSAFQPLCSAVIAGLQPGTIFVDREDAPQAAFMNVWNNWGFLAGRPAPEFISALNDGLLKHSLIGEQVEFLILTVEETWDAHLPALFHPRHPVPLKRRHYSTAQIEFDWRSNIPTGFEIKPITPELLNLANLPEEVRQTLERWQNCNHPEFRDCGVVAMSQGEVVAWTTVDAITGRKGDIGLVTLEPYRRKGLAAATAGAAAEQAFARGVETIHWTCMDGNPGSIRTAEKLGFTFQKNYDIYYFEFDELWDQIQYAGHLIKNGDYSASLTECEKALAVTSSPPPGLLIHTARAQAMSGMLEAALDTIAHLLKSGWQDSDFLENDPLLAPLRNTERWSEMIADLLPR